ncbi:MAG: rhomboid family intramembrane serine protease [Flavobacteriales bacterium]
MSDALKQDRQNIKDALIWTLLLLACMWLPYMLEALHFTDFKDMGLHPREWRGLLGVLTMHFLHGDLDHILHNTMAIAVFNTLLFYFYRSICLPIVGWIFLVAPLLLWIMGREGNHIGASLLIYGQFSFLALSGMLRRNPILMRVSLVVVLYYGSLIWYLFPIDQHISWEGHAAGFIVGAALAVLYRNQGPQRRVYQYEVDPELPDDENAYWKIPNTSEESSSQRETTVSVKYHYKEDQPN